MGNNVSGENCSDQDNNETCQAQFPLLELNPYIRASVLSKLDHRSYARMEESCKEIKIQCAHVQGPIVRDVHAIFANKRTIKVDNTWWDYRAHKRRTPLWIASRKPIAIRSTYIDVERRLDDKKCKRLTQTFRLFKTTTFSLFLNQQITCKPHLIGEMMDVLQPIYLEIVGYVGPGIVELEQVKKITGLRLKSCRLTDKQLLQLKGESMEIDCDTVTAKGINEFIKSWKFGTRSLQGLYLNFDTSSGTLNTAEILAGLDANIVWTPEDHEHSLLNNIPREHCQELWSDSPRNVYSIFRHTNIADILLVYISQNAIQITAEERETDFLYVFTGEDEYYRAMNECRYCRRRFCSHRRRYSTDRLSREFPIAWAIFMAAVCGITVGWKIGSVVHFYGWSSF